MMPPAGPSFQKGPPFKRLWLSSRVGRAQLLPSLLSSLRFADLSLEPFGVSAPSRALPRCSDHWAFRLRWDSHRCPSGSPLQATGGRGQGSQATSPSLALHPWCSWPGAPSGQPMVWRPDSRLPLPSLSWPGLLPSQPWQESLHIPQRWPLRTAACLAMRVVHFFVPLQHPPLHSSPTPQLGTGGRSPATVLLVGTVRGKITSSCRTQDQRLRNRVSAAPSAPAYILQKPIGAEPGSTVWAPLWAWGEAGARDR